MPTKNKLKYWIEKKYRSRPGYPMATVACYGPNDRFATKLVITILQSEKDKEAAILKRWFSEAIDVRLDLNIIQQAMDFLDEHPVKNVAIMERIIGCPHEEGIDFPAGEKCSQCPFWADRNRWTGELLPEAKKRLKSSGVKHATQESITDQPVQTRIGVAWYRPVQWEALREVSSDRDKNGSRLR